MKRIIVLSFVFLTGCYGIDKLDNGNLKGKNIIITKVHGCRFKITETSNSVKMDRLEVDTIIRNNGCSSYAWNTPVSIDIKCRSEEQLASLAYDLDKWYATGKYPKKEKPEPDSFTEISCEFTKSSDLTNEEKLIYIANPPMGDGDGWMDIHSGRYTENCPLIDLSTGWADHRTLKDITSSTFCDAPGHYKDTEGRMFKPRSVEKKEKKYEGLFNFEEADTLLMIL